MQRRDYFSGCDVVMLKDEYYWTSWIEKRMDHVEEVMDAVDLFIAPARYLMERFISSGRLKREKIKYLDYGFELSRFKKDFPKIEKRPFTFGYIGRHVPAKGIHLLIQAFGKLNGDQRLIIWGRPRGDVTPFLKEQVTELPEERRKRIEFRSEYENINIQSEVFQHVDAIVVPSIWVENSPLVIHEAQAVRVPVIASKAGGMGEYVHHMKNGLVFEHRDADDLSAQMQYLSENPKLARELGQRGYIWSADGQIPDIKSHIDELLSDFEKLIAAKGK